MGWELRKGHRYYYLARKLDGRVVRKYMIRGTSPLAAKAVILLADGERHQREEREAKRRESVELGARVGELLRTAAEANAELGVAIEAMLLAVGYHRVNRGRWRMARKKQPSAADDADGGEDLKHPPHDQQQRLPTGTGEAMLVHIAPNNNPDAAALFARVRAGDEAAREELRRWVREKDSRLHQYGDLAARSTAVLIDKITGGDPVWRVCLEEKAIAMKAELLGDEATGIDHLIVRRILNGWLAVHALEVESAVRPPRQMRDRAYLEAAIGKASKRFAAAVTELARVRKLQLPNVLVNITPPISLPLPLPRVAKVEMVEAKGKGTSANGTAGRRQPAKRTMRGKGPGRKAASG